HAQLRPGTFGPPGGVYKYFGSGASFLASLGFTAELLGCVPEVNRSDLRGYLPASSVPDFLSWFAAGQWREDPIECLRRELAEELGEVGLVDLEADVPHLTFSRIRSIVEGPGPAPGRPYQQLRGFDIHDLDTVRGPAERFKRKLLAAGADPGQPFVRNVNAADIRRGSHGGSASIAPQSAFL
nr:hypothetical protein [Micromonospora sp. DSM 115978]